MDFVNSIVASKINYRKDDQSFWVLIKKHSLSNDMLDIRQPQQNDIF